MIHVVVGRLASQLREGLIVPIRSDRAPLSAEGRDVLSAMGLSAAERLEQMGDLPVGAAFVTPGGELGVSFVIHVVTASPEDAETDRSTQRALRNGLRRATEWGLESVALPPIGLGAGRLDAEEAARGVVEILMDHLDEGNPPSDLTIVVGGDYEAQVFGQVLAALTADRRQTPEELCADGS